MAMVTAEELASKYKVDLKDPAQIEVLLATAEEACLSYISAESGEVEEYFNGGSDSFALTHHPVQKILAVEVAGSPVAYRMNSRAAQVVLFEPAPARKGNVKISYLCGWAPEEVPAGLKACIAFTVQHLARLTNAKLMGVLSRSTDMGSETFEQAALPITVKSLLDHFKGSPGM